MRMIKVVVSLLLLWTSLATADITSNLVLWLKADDQVSPTADSSGQGHTGTLTGNATFSTTTKKYGAAAFQFDGTDDWVQGTVPSFTTAMTVMAWVNVTNVTTNRAVFHDDGDAIDLRFDQAGNSFYCTLKTTGWVIAYHTPSPSSGAWHHVACTYNGSVIMLYIDGVSASNDNLAQTGNLAETGNYYVGTRGDAGDFLGFIDDVRMFQRVLTEQEVNDAMNDPGQAGAVPRRTIALE